MRKGKAISLLLILLVLASCNKFRVGETDNPVARVGSNYLYNSDIIGLVPSGFAADDSLRMVRDYIDNWINQQLMMQLAEATLNLKDRDFKQQLEDYKRSLILYKYESEIIAQRLDTIVSEKEIMDYYSTYQRNFELKENIVKVLYVKVTPEAPDLQKLQKLMRSDEPEALEELEEFCAAYAVNYFLDNNTWLYFSDLLKEIPIQTYNQEAYLQNNRFIELSADPFIYFVRFLDFRVRESISPLSFERDNIRTIILNKRKIRLIQNIQDELLQKARMENKVELF